MESFIENIDCLDGLKKLPDKSVQLVVTSPPYNMGDERYYKNYEDNKSSKEYTDWLLEINKEVFRVLKDDGVYVLNINYNRNSPHENLKVVTDCVYQIGFILREQVCWDKKGFPITEKRNYTRDWEFIAILTKSNDYKTNQRVNEVISNKWVIKNANVQNNQGLNKWQKKELIKNANAYPFDTNLNNATFPVNLPIKCIEEFTDNENDVVLDMFIGTGTTAIASIMKNRKYIGFELDKETYDLCIDNINKQNNQKSLDIWF